MKKILFSHSYFLRFDPKQWAAGQPYAPLGTLYAAAVLRENGYAVSLFDSMFAHTAEDCITALDNHRPDIFVIYDDGFNYLTKMCLTNMREAAFKMIQYAKERNCIVIVSSSDATDHYEKYLQQGADFVLLGEAELTLLELVNTIAAGENEYMGVAGITYREKEAVIKTARRNVLKDLDSLPFPAWDIADLEPYRKMWLKSSGYFSMNMATTRGCPFKCNWCAKPIYGNRYNSRSPGNVVAELRFLHERYRFDHIWFCDDIFGLKPGWVAGFAALMEKEKFVFSYKIQSRVDLLLQDETIQELAKSGCTKIWMGAESGSQQVLDAMDKGTTVPQIYEATRRLKKNGIHPCFFIQFGYPGETKEDIRKTIGMINELLPHEIGISVSYPLPGTAFFDKVKNELKEKANWTDSDELALMFSNTYQPAFYKQLHRYVHASYRKHKAIAQARKLLLHPKSISILSVKKAASIIYYLPASILLKKKLTALQFK